MKRIIIFFVVISQCLNAQIQEVCDELNLIPYDITQSNYQYQMGDTVSIDSSLFTLIIESDMCGENEIPDPNLCFFISDGINVYGDHVMRVIPPANVSEFYIEANTSVANFYMSVIIDEIDILNVIEVNGTGYINFSFAFTDYPVSVNGVTVSLDTTLIFSPGDTAIHLSDSRFKLKFEGVTNTTSILIRNSCDLLLERICTSGEALSINEINDYDFQFFDNNMLNINLKNNFGTLNLFNTQGQFIKKYNIDEEEIIDFNFLAQGAYFVQLIVKDNIYSEKIMVK